MHEERCVVYSTLRGAVAGSVFVFSGVGLHTRRKCNEKVTEIMRAVEVVEVSGCLEADCLLLYGIDAVFLDHALEVPDHLLRNTLPHQ